MNKIVISVDIEDWYHNPAIIGSEFAKFETIDQFLKFYNINISKFVKYLNEVLKLLSNYDIKATFFIVADMARRFPCIIERILKDDHEIASHGLYHYIKYDPKLKKMRYDINEFEDMTAESKYILEKLSGKKILGYRAPGAYICGEMIDSLEKIGFKYDSSVSVNSFYTKTDGTAFGVTTSPYYPTKGKLSKGNRKRNIIEFPWPYYELFGIKFPTAGGPFLRFFGKNYIKKGIEQSLKRSDTMFYFHVIDISDEKFPFLDIRRPFYFAIKGKIIKDKVNALLDTFRDRMCRFIDILPKYVNI